MIESRRQFTRQALQSLTAFALIDGLAAHRLFGDDVAAHDQRLDEAARRHQPGRER